MFIFIAFIIFIFTVPAIIAGVAASVLFDVALHYGLLGQTADGTRPRVRKLYFSNVFVGLAATYGAFYVSTYIPQSDISITFIGGVFAVLIVLAIKFTSLCCATRRARRAHRDPDNSNTIEPTDTGRVAFAPHA